MKILGIETCTEACSIAIADVDAGANPSNLLVRHSVPGRGHGDRVLGDIDELLREADWQLGDLDLIACGMGPGSFTGVRIGVSAAKSIAFGVELPLLGVSTLQIMAQTSEHDRVFTALDARMGEVYFGAYARDEAGLMRAALDDVVIDPHKLDVDVDGDDWAGVGHGFSAYREALKDRLPVADTNIDPDGLPHAKALLELAAGLADEANDPVVLVPGYLRDNVAKVKQTTSG